jgi:hypothetical protein
VRFGCGLADAGYRMSAPFRQALSQRGLSWAVGIPGRQKVYPADVAMIFWSQAPADLDSTASRTASPSPPKGCWLGTRGDGSTGAAVRRGG